MLFAERNVIATDREYHSHTVIDSHCHLTDDAFVDDLSDVIARSQSAGISRALCIVACDNDTERARAHQLATLWDAVSFGTGVHPHNAGRFAQREDDMVRQVRSAASALAGTVAIGEIGLDYHYDFAPRDVQQLVFRRQIRLARELDLPIIIHTREAEDDTITILKEESEGAVRGVMHCFTGTRRLADEALALGMYLSFAGIITFPKGGNVRDTAAIVPLDRLLCETDSPYLAPAPYRGKRNEPAWVVRVCEALAEVRGISPEELGQQIDRNFRELFRP